MLCACWSYSCAYFTGNYVQRYQSLLTSSNTSDVEVQHTVFLRVVVAIGYIDIKLFTELSFSHTERFRLAVEDVGYCY